MKVTKVNSTRIAVVNKIKDKNKVVLYAAAPNRYFKSETIERVLAKRVENANRLYGVFFRGDGKTIRLPNGLEDKFTWLMISMEVKFKKEIEKAYNSGIKSEIERCINKEIEWLKGISKIEKIKWDYNKKEYVVERQAEFSELKSNEIEEKILDAAIVRMRQSLKRGTNKRIVKTLLKALSQGDRKVYVNALEDMKQTDEKALGKFIDSVNRDYYKTNIIRSLVHHDVKVQVNDELLDLANVHNEKGKKRALTEILEKYASSSEAATEVLLNLKRVLFEYFFSYTEEKSGKFFVEENLWKIPSEVDHNDVIFGGFFDEGFVVSKDYAKSAAKRVPHTIEELSKEKEVDFAKVRNRVRFVNYGKYLQILTEVDSDDEIKKFWLSYIKEYIEKNYVDKNYVDGENKTKKARKDIYSYRRISMFKECWKDSIRYLCGKYIDLGKAVYHFGMPEKICLDKNRENSYGNIRPEYKFGISSFAYEAIKAEETLQRNVAISTVSSLSAFSRSVLIHEKQKESGNEDILFIKNEELSTLLRTDAKKMVLRYYGGQSEVQIYDIDEKELVQEIKAHLSLIRNENFHYTAGKLAPLAHKNTLKLWENDIQAYAQLVRDKFYSNNAAMFYSKNDIVNLVTTIYKEKKKNIHQVPAFRTIWKRKEMPIFINEIEKKIAAHWLKDSAIRTKYEGALYFLLKEIYYNDFILNEHKARQLFIDEVEKYNGTQGVEKSQEAAKHFKNFVSNLKQQNLSLGQMCEMINMEYNQQNANVKQEEGNGQKEIYKHFKMLLPLCMKSAYQKYLVEKYKFLYKPSYDENMKGEPDYLDTVNIDCGLKVVLNVESDEDKRRIAWYTFAHFIHPKQLNLLIGDFKSYIQYREDIVRRARYAQSNINLKKEEIELKASVKRAESVLEILEFVRPIAGRVSNVFDDYYESEEEYAKYLSNYIDFAKGEVPSFSKLVKFCKSTLGDGQVIDLYADEKNPKVLRNVEIARMYAGGDVAIKQGFEKIDEKTIKKYYQNKDRVSKILSKGYCESREEQEAVIEQQQLKGHLTLNEVTEVFSMINDLLGQLVSLSYLRERDKMYLLLGYYYMAMRNAESWTEEVIDTLDKDGWKVEKGLALYQVVSVFDYGTPLLYLGSKGKWKMSNQGMSIGNKEIRFHDMHNDSIKCAMKLFEKFEYGSDIREIRNYVDHFKYYTSLDRSIVELYWQFYTQFFGYSSKLRKSALKNFKNILEKYFLVCEMQIVSEKKSGNDKDHLSILKLDSVEFTYNLKPKRKDEPKVCKAAARSCTFEKLVEDILKYPEK